MRLEKNQLCLRLDLHLFFFFKKRIFKIKIHVTLRPWRRAGIHSGVQQFDVKKATCIVASFLLFFLFQEKKLSLLDRVEKNT